MTTSSKTLEELAGEIQGVGAIVSTISLLVEPSRRGCNGSTPSQETVDAVFYSIMNTLDRIAEDLYGHELDQLTSARRRRNDEGRE